ncbi:P-loop containing nucleoside triphosphate hydrolase protein [Zychaea mexicana]|uniref:P-loop containing nucleoside triphosphate hydrolase protein n=1 Tax=Zychaea mexicana TaxID=64656 RepID=UPI0022FE88DB|nr:P-loop containing nucleoside triphosphate hydrolase protein [Zychaea mexicana]KAI9499133.1 P-loop containing nucleoside triphosphate hydrolase protein [Zychaea mexicana]
MAPLEVIGAGMSRNGTDSLRQALDILGYNTHHVHGMVGIDWHPEAFTEAYEHPDKPADWDSIYKGYSAAVDSPTVFFLDRLIEYYPNAKVILTKRDPDTWYNSLANTLDNYVEQFKEENLTDYMRRFYRMATTIWPDGPLQNPEQFKKSPEKMKARYEAHNAWVIENISADRLLVLDLREGITWERICPFLGRPIPAEPYPRSNATVDFNKIDMTDRSPKDLETLRIKEKHEYH